MKVFINGKENNLAKDQITVSELLEIQKVQSPEMVSVQINEQILSRKEFGSACVKEQDRVEFLYFMGGGAPSPPGHPRLPW